MIPYELAKKLKDAGFPQKGGLMYSNGRNIGVNSIGFKKLDLEIPDGYILSPSLEQLIEACGEDFEGILKSRFNKELATKEWLACEGEFKTDGDTPEEAVSMLYLKLHGKD